MARKEHNIAQEIRGSGTTQFKGRAVCSCGWKGPWKFSVDPNKVRRDINHKGRWHKIMS